MNRNLFRAFLLLASLFFGTTSLLAQSEHDIPKKEEVKANELVEVPASYPGGESALLAFVSQNLVYPSIALEQELQGVVVLRFRVEKDGSIGEIVIKKSLSKECDKAAADVVKKLKRFVPAQSQGQPVTVWFMLPIRFTIFDPLPRKKK